MLIRRALVFFVYLFISLQVNVLFGATLNLKEYQLQHSLANENIEGSTYAWLGDSLLMAGGVENGQLSDSVWLLQAKEGLAKGRWQKSKLNLPSPIAHASSASSEWGVFVIGGAHNNVQKETPITLLQWSEEQNRLTSRVLPALPHLTIHTQSVVMGDVLYVLSGSDGKHISEQVYSLNVGNLLKTGGDEQWQLVSKLPHSSPNAETKLLAVVQHTGKKSEVGLHVLRWTKQDEFVFSDMFVLRSAQPEAGTTWQENARIPHGITANQHTSLYSDVVPLGSSYIVLMPNFSAQGIMAVPLFFNTITDTWTSYLAEKGDAKNGQLVLSSDGKVLLHNTQYTFIKEGATGVRLYDVEIKGKEPQFGWVNMLVLTLYLLSMVLVGVYFVFKNASTDDYFRGGQSVPWWAAACSIYATMLSSLTYVALPSLVYRTDWLVLMGTLTIVLAAPIAVYVAMPFFRQIDATSAYEYLSKRFNLSVRLFASGLFTLFHISRMGIVMALTALALSVATPLTAEQSVLIMGVLCLIYCTLGGVEAVIWTDTIQTIVLLIGAVLCFIYILSGIEGGFSGFLATGLVDEKFTMVNINFSSSSFTELAIWVVVLGGLSQNISTYTADQAVVQRYMVTTNPKKAANSIWANAALAAPGSILFFCIGTGLYCFYKFQPEKLDPTIQIDQIFPAFIVNELPIGIAGLIVAGIFAAAQSTVSTSMNSIATTIVTDFMRSFNVCKTEQGYFRAAKWLTFLMGVLGTLAALLFINPEIRSLMEEYFVVVGMFMGALGGLFVLGVLSDKASSVGAMIGLISGVLIMIIVWQLKWVNGYLFAALGIIFCVLIGYVASFIFPQSDKDIHGLTWSTMRNNK